MEAPPQQANLEETLTQLEALIESFPSENRKQLLSQHKTNDQPTLHHLASLNYRVEDTPRLEKLIKFFVDSGYDLDNVLSTVESSVYHHPSVNALFASIHAKNQIFTECLLRNGARPDARNPDGYSACHVAIFVGDLKSLEILVKYGGASILATTPDEKMGINDIGPLLHTTVDFDHPQILCYLLSLKEFEVDLQDKAVYEEQELTVLDRAFLLNQRENFSEVVGILLKTLFQDSRFGELYYHLAVGDTETACTLLDNFSPEELASAKIENRWALHCLHPRAFVEKPRLEFTKKLISHFVGCGWNLNSECDFFTRLYSVEEDENRFRAIVKASRCSLLHTTCFSSAKPEMIKWLVEAGAEVNCLTEGQVEVSPLLILVGKLEWESAGYLIDKGADVNIRGYYGGRLDSSEFMRRNLTTGEWEPVSTLNPVELLLRLRRKIELGEGMQLLERILATSSYVSNGVSEFHFAMQTADLPLVSKVAEKYARKISSEDLKYMGYCGEGDSPEMVPSICVLLRNLQGSSLGEQSVRFLRRLTELMLRAGLDINVGWDFESIFSIFALRVRWDSKEILLFLQTLLRMPDLVLNGNNNHHISRLFEIICAQLETPCSRTSGACYISCRKDVGPYWPAEALKLLITHGFDMSQEFICYKFRFHSGYTDMCKLIFASGSAVFMNFFGRPTLCRFANRELRKEFSDLEKWKKAFDQKEGASLQHKCRVAVRRTLKSVKDLETLDGMTKNIYDYILCRNVT